MQLTIIPEPQGDTRIVLAREMGADTIYIDGSLDEDHPSSFSQDCGACGAPLIVGVSRESVTDLVLRCPACGAFNDTKWGPDQSNVPRFSLPTN